MGFTFRGIADSQINLSTSPRYMEGRLVQGYGVASGKANDPRFPGGTIAMQAPHFKEKGFDFDAYFGGAERWIRGTMNVDMDPYDMSVTKADHFLENVDWGGKNPENFFLIETSLKFRGKEYKALIYVPDPATKTEHLQSSSMIEIIAERIPDIKYGDALHVMIDSAKMKPMLRYDSFCRSQATVLTCKL